MENIFILFLYCLRTSQSSIIHFIKLLGRRACLGESLAKVELFLFFVNFLQKYNICLPEGSKVTTEPMISVISSPQPYGVVFSCRWVGISSL